MSIFLVLISNDDHGMKSQARALLAGFGTVLVHWMCQNWSSQEDVEILVSHVVTFGY